MTLEQLWKGTDAVLFDFDGVLTDSEPFYRRSWNEILADYGHSVSEPDYWKYWAYLGLGLQGEIQRTGLRVPDPENARRRQKELYRSYCISGMIELLPGAGDVLRTAMELRKCAIASNTDSELVRAIAGREMDHLPQVIGGEGLPSKPAPDIFLKASASLDVEPERCLVIEDALKGVRAAAQANMPVILVRNHCNRGLPAGEATMEIAGLHVLADFLKGESSAR